MVLNKKLYINDRCDAQGIFRDAGALAPAVGDAAGGDGGDDGDGERGYEGGGEVIERLRLC